MLGQRSVFPPPGVHIPINLICLIYFLENWRTSRDRSHLRAYRFIDCNRFPGYKLDRSNGTNGRKNALRIKKGKIQFEKHTRQASKMLRLNDRGICRFWCKWCSSHGDDIYTIHLPHSHLIGCTRVYRHLHITTRTCIIYPQTNIPYYALYGIVYIVLYALCTRRAVCCWACVLLPPPPLRLLLLTVDCDCNEIMNVK